MGTLLIDLLEWLGPGARPYAEVMDAWRTSCPRLPVWEEANARGYIEQRRVEGAGVMVSASALGKAIAKAHPAMRIVEAPDLVLEPQVAEHARAMFEVLRDPALYAYENDPPESPEALRARMERLESRKSPDGREAWLNWVVRLPGIGPIGFVQATVHSDARAAIAYVLSSAHWGRGLGRQAVAAMMDELAAHHRARRFSAVFKRANVRSIRLLERLGFSPATPEELERFGAARDESIMVRDAGAPAG